MFEILYEGGLFANWRNKCIHAGYIIYILNNSPQYRRHRTEVSFADSSTHIRLLSLSCTAHSRVNTHGHQLS